MTLCSQDSSLSLSSSGVRGPYGPAGAQRRTHAQVRVWSGTHFLSLSFFVSFVQAMEARLLSPPGFNAQPVLG